MYFNWYAVFLLASWLPPHFDLSQAYSHHQSVSLMYQYKVLPEFTVFFLKHEKKPENDWNRRKWVRAKPTKRFKGRWGTVKYGIHHICFGSLHLFPLLLSSPSVSAAAKMDASQQREEEPRSVPIALHCCKLITTLPSKKKKKENHSTRPLSRAQLSPVTRT